MARGLLPLPPTTREDLWLDGYLEYPHATKALHIYKHPCLLRDSNPVPTAPQSASLTTLSIGRLIKNIHLVVQEALKIGDRCFKCNGAYKFSSLRVGQPRVGLCLQEITTRPSFLAMVLGERYPSLGSQPN
ncbi:uncharacterized protein TNCV_3762061 [Trichonephila clavipes]|nr:uncharacterized protein TNCV_3762061 [Trichonephila clavipes]